MDENFLFIKTLPSPLSKEEMKKLFIEKQNGSIEARQILITKNLRLVTYELERSFKDNNYDKKDLLSVGIVGLIKAVDAYSLSQGSEFSTYAIKCITNEIKRFLKREKKHSQVISYQSLVTTPSESNEITIEDFLISEIDLIRDYEDKEIKGTLNFLISKLPIREQEIIKLYFGFYDNKIYSEGEIGNMFNCSKANISRIIIKTLKLLKSELKKTSVIAINKSLINKEEIVTDEDYFKLTEILSSKKYDKMINELDAYERPIILLKFGYVGGKNFTNEAISKILNIKISEIQDITNRFLIKQKEQINKILTTKNKVKTL